MHFRSLSLDWHLEGQSAQVRISNGSKARRMEKIRLFSRQIPIVTKKTSGWRTGNANEWKRTENKNGSFNNTFFFMKHRRYYYQHWQRGSFTQLLYIAIALVASDSINIFEKEYTEYSSYFDYLPLLSTTNVRVNLRIQASFRMMKMLRRSRNFFKEFVLGCYKQ